MNAQTQVSPARDRPWWRRIGGLPGLLLLAALVLSVAVLAGCGSADDADTTVSTPPEAGGSLGMLAPPGLYDLEEGRTQALGVLAYQDLEGGFWAVVESLPDQPAEGAKVVAVLVGAEDLGVDLDALAGRFVAADGVLIDGASVRMAGPELSVESLREAVDMVVSPAGAGE